MSKSTVAQKVETSNLLPSAQGILQRKCACGNQTVGGGECTECGKKKLGLQRKLTIGASNDPLEREADRVADQVMAMPTNSNIGRVPPRIQRLTGRSTDSSQITAPASVDRVLAGSGRPLEPALQHDMEQRFNHDFSQVRVHSETVARQSAREVNANAYTVGHNIVFGSGQLAPRTHDGRRLIAHELTHVVQQLGGEGVYASQSNHGLPLIRQLQRTLNDGHDLTSPRFSRLLDLEEAYDDESLVREGSSGRGVQAIQQALYDLGFSLPVYGVDGQFGSETKAAVQEFQRANPPLVDDGKVGPLTMTELDTRFGAFALPALAVLSVPWTPSCVRLVLCPWSPHTVEVLRTRITLKSFDSISWADERWNGVAWVLDPFPGGGYNTGTEIGVLNDSCEGMSEKLYHEVLHAEQPTTHGTTLERESYAYRIGEEFSIAMGLGGRPALRNTDAEGREFADPAQVGTFVATTYPSVPAGGGGDQIISKAVAHGHVRIRRLDGSIFTRPAVVGEKVPPDPDVPTVANEVTHPTVGWTCP